MGFFDIGRYREDNYAKNKRAAENKRLQEEVEMCRYRQRQDDYDREQADYRARVKREQERENNRELRFNLYEEKKELMDALEDLKLRIKYGIVEDE